MKITAAVTDTEGAPFVLQEVELDQPRADELVVRVEAAGVCQTDLKAVKGGRFPLPGVLGHEGAGVVESVGAAVTRYSPGDRVAISFSSCSYCDECAQGRPAYCLHFAQENFGGSRSDGSPTISRAGSPLGSNFFGQSSFATHALVAERNVVRLDDDVPFEIAAPMACGFQTGAGTVLNVLPFTIDSTLLVIGAGAVGMAAALAARAFGALVVVVDPVAERRRRASELGVVAVDSATSELTETLRGLAAGGFDFAIDTSGSPEARAAAFGALAQDGQFVIATPGPPEIVLPTTQILRARSVRGVVEGASVPRVFLPRLFALWRSGRFPVEPLIKTFRLDEFSTALDELATGSVVKAVILPGA